MPVLAITRGGGKVWKLSLIHASPVNEEKELLMAEFAVIERPANVHRGPWRRSNPLIKAIEETLTTGKAVLVDVDTKAAHTLRCLFAGRAQRAKSRGQQSFVAHAAKTEHGYVFWLSPTA